MLHPRWKQQRGVAAFHVSGVTATCECWRETAVLPCWELSQPPASLLLRAEEASFCMRQDIIALKKEEITTNSKAWEEFRAIWQTASSATVFQGGAHPELSLVAERCLQSHQHSSCFGSSCCSSHCWPNLGQAVSVGTNPEVVSLQVG